MQIYVAHGTVRSGPHSLEEIQSRLEARAISPDDLAWYEGIKDWVPLSQVPGLKIPESGPPLRPGSPPLRASTTSTHQHAPARPRRTGLLITSGVIAILLSLWMLGTGVTWMAEPNRDGRLGVGLVLLGIVVGFVSVQLFMALRGNPTGCCQVCGEVRPTIYGSLNRHIGAVILMFHAHITGHMCKGCIAEIFWRFTITTFTIGWWGVISFFLTPLVLVNNVAYYVRSRLMD